MSLTVVGSIAFDTVSTPAGERERMLGGAATHFALAASYFDRVHLVGPVGSDFGEEHMDVLRTRGSNVDDVELMADGRTFFWQGEYGWDLNTRETIDTQLNVFEDFEPKLSETSRACDLLFLANIQPQLQLQVLDQCGSPDYVALDSMNLWIEIARDPLVEVIGRVDCVILNDAELRQLTDKPNLLSAAREVLGWGPSVVVAKQGEYGEALVTEDGFFALPAYPLPEVVDPTGAGDTFAGGFLGYVARNIDQAADDEVLRNATAYGSALASFNVQDFGTERLQDLMAEEVVKRVDELQGFSSFEHAEIELSGEPPRVVDSGNQTPRETP